MLAHHGQMASANIGRRVIDAETGTTGHGVKETGNENVMTEIAVLRNQAREPINEEESRDP